MVSTWAVSASAVHTRRRGTDRWHPALYSRRVSAPLTRAAERAKCFVRAWAGGLKKTANRIQLSLSAEEVVQQQQYDQSVDRENHSPFYKAL
jgi:hypothetical protein